MIFEQIIIGAIQGITEWLPVSSSGVITLVKKTILHNSQSIESISKENLFLHFGTFLSALIYLRNEVIILIKNFFFFSKADKENQNVIKFLVITTLISGTIGAILIKLLSTFEAKFDMTGKLITVVIGIFLLITAFIEFNSKNRGYKGKVDLKTRDALLLGIAQGFAALPGISRSGITVSTLLLRKFDKSTSLKLSFLMSLPIVLAGNIILNISECTVSVGALVGLLSAFIFGLAFIHILIKIAQKINFGYFMLFFGGLTILSAFL